ncbi:hypothetical protein Veis_3960 [Verminephrobacter eiseniae EF01-2]|uniref:PIN domain-containing protein n=1 Tax=Verminephrobacter eiseniae (strain EF01-2) TaxID=391735 RepID=A1WPW0_VEREI|nr:hypothetical protein Veis_3960 [Verminephrobacter eiseniae EF01-2]
MRRPMRNRWRSRWRACANLSGFCAWRMAYRLQPSDAAAAIRALLACANVQVNRPAVQAGLSVLEAVGDFADGVIAHGGHWLGAEGFVSFDKKAVALLTAQGRSARLW